MDKCINNSSYRKDTSNYSTDLNQKVEEIVFILPKFDSNRGHIESEVHSRKISARGKFVRVAGELIYIVSVAFNIYVGGRDDLRKYYIENSF